MTDKKQGLIDQSLQDLNNDGIDRRGFLKCMAWAGTGLLWTMSGGVPMARSFRDATGHGHEEEAVTSASCRSATATSASTSQPTVT